MANIDNKTNKQLLLIYKSIAKLTIPEKGDGWVNLAAFGSAMRKADIDFHKLGGLRGQILLSKLSLITNKLIKYDIL